MKFTKLENTKFNSDFFDTMRMNSPKHVNVPLWVEMIRDLVDGAEYSYSRIAYRAGVTPASIQKLATIPGRVPRQRNFLNLIKVYYHAFYRKGVSPSAKNYIKEKTNDHLGWIAKIPVQACSSFEKTNEAKRPKQCKVSINYFNNYPHCQHCAPIFIH